MHNEILRMKPRCCISVRDPRPSCAIGPIQRRQECASRGKRVLSVRPEVLNHPWYYRIHARSTDPEIQLKMKEGRQGVLAPQGR